MPPVEPSKAVCQIRSVLHKSRPNSTTPISDGRLRLIILKHPTIMLLHTRRVSTRLDAIALRAGDQCERSASPTSLTESSSSVDSQSRRNQRTLLGGGEAPPQVVAAACAAGLASLRHVDLAICREQTLMEIPADAFHCSARLDSTHQIRDASEGQRAIQLHERPSCKAISACRTLGMHCPAIFFQPGRVLDVSKTGVVVRCPRLRSDDHQLVDNHKFCPKLKGVGKVLQRLFRIMLVGVG